MKFFLLFFVIVTLHTHAFKPTPLIGKGSALSCRRSLNECSFSRLKNQIQAIDLLEPGTLVSYLHVPSFLTNEPTQRTYDIPGPANPTSKPVRQLAAEILAYFKALNYDSTATPDLITFRGVLGKSRAQAAFLTFCTFLGLASFGLVLSVLLPDVGTKAYLVTLLSPYAGIYYWNNAQRIDEVKVKIEISDDEQITTVIAQGDKEDLERFSKTLNLPERGKIYVKGIFENDDKKEAMMNNYIILDKKQQISPRDDVPVSAPPSTPPPPLEANNSKSQ